MDLLKIKSRIKIFIIRNVRNYKKEISKIKNK